MNATAAAKTSVKRAARFNSWALAVFIALLAVLAVKAQTERAQFPTRHFEALSCSAPAPDTWLPCERRPAK